MEMLLGQVRSHTGHGLGCSGAAVSLVRSPCGTCAGWCNPCSSVPMLWGTVDIAVWAPHTTEDLPIGWDDCIGSQTAVGPCRNHQTHHHPRSHRTCLSRPWCWYRNCGEGCLTGATVLVEGLHLARELGAVAVGDQLAGDSLVDQHGSAGWPGGRQHARAETGPPARGVPSLGLLHLTILSGVGKSHTGYQSCPSC